MSGRLNRLLDRGSRLIDGDAGEVFVIGGLPITGNFSGGDESLELTVSGGQQEHVHGTLVITRSAYPALVPGLMAIIIGPDKTRYRIGKLDSDAITWTLTLTHPNERRSR